MENNNSFDKNLEKLISSHGQEQKMDEQQKKNIIKNLTNNNTQAQIPVTTQSRVWRKIAIAAMLVLVPAVIAIYVILPSEQKIEIPPELASMSIEELVALNYDTSQNTFDSNIVKYALKQALEKATPEKVIQIAKSLDDGGMDRQASLAAPPVHPIEHFGYASKTFNEVIEQSNLFVHANLIDVHINVDDIIAALVEKEMYKNFEHYVSRYRVAIKLHVVDCLRENMLKKGREITVQTTIAENKLNMLKKNSGYYFGMTQDKNNKSHFLEYFSGVYSVDYNKPANIEMWQFVKDAQDILLYGQTPKSEAIEYWVSKLQGDTYLLALEYMNILPDDLLPAESIIDALEKGYSDYILFALTSEEKMSNTDDEAERIKTSNEVYNMKHNIIALFEKTMSLLLRSSDINSTRRMLSMIEEDIKDNERGIIRTRYGINGRVSLPLIFSTVIASENEGLKDEFVEAYIKIKKYVGNELLGFMQTTFSRDLTVELIKQISKLPSYEAQPMLINILNNSTEFGLYEASDCRQIWTLLGSNEDYNIRSKLEDFLYEPNLSDIGMERIRNGENIGLSVFSFEQAAFETLMDLPESIRPDHDTMIDYLLMIYERNKHNRSCVNFTVNTFRDILRPTDTDCLSVIQELFSADRPNWNLPNIVSQRIPNPALVPDIMAAMDSETFDNNASLIEALFACGEKEQAIEMTIKKVEEPFSEDSPRDLLNDLRSKAGLVLFLGKTKMNELEPLIDQYTHEDSLEKYRNFSEDLVGRLVGYTVDELLQNSVMALSRLGEKSSIPRLREIYNTTDNIRVKIIAAIGLYYNGDNTGQELIRHFVEGTHHEVPEIEMRWGVDISDGTVFQRVIDSYLRNELTDALWLEKLSYYLDRADTNIDNDFFKDHRKEILNIAAGHLNNKNKAVRQYALEILQKATGQYFGFDSDRYAGQQEEIIEQWKEYLDSIEK